MSANRRVSERRLAERREHPPEMPARERTAPRLARLWLLGLVATAATVAMSYAWLDRPIAHLVDGLIGRPAWLGRLIDTPALFGPLAGLGFVVLIVRRIASRPFGRPDAVLVVGCISLVIGLAAKLALKILFGRTWPRLLVRDGIYGFYPFHAGPAYSSFPSGHTAAVCAVATVLWIWYPRLRPAWLIGAILSAATLVGTNYHFVGDVVAGAFLGVTTTLIALGIWHLIGHRFGGDQRDLPAP
jgi:membrane-associated phospholipid phosphatase